MFSFFKSKNDSRPLDQYLVRYLAGTYQMSSDETDKLHYVTASETLADQKITMFRIFDPSMAIGSAEKMTYEALSDHTASVLFEGRFAKNKTVTEIKDLRDRS